MRRTTSLAFFLALLFVGAGALKAQELPTVTPHDVAGKEACSMCHAEGVMGATKTPATHEGRSEANCQLCHSKASPVQVAAAAASDMPHDLAGKENCAMCHAEGVMGASKTPDNHSGEIEIPADACTECHKPAG